MTERVADDYAEIALRMKQIKQEQCVKHEWDWIRSVCTKCGFDLNSSRVAPYSL